MTRRAVSLYFWTINLEWQVWSEEWIRTMEESDSHRHTMGISSSVHCRAALHCTPCLRTRKKKCPIYVFKVLMTSRLYWHSFKQVITNVGWFVRCQEEWFHQWEWAGDCKDIGLWHAMGISYFLIPAKARCDFIKCLIMYWRPQDELLMHSRNIYESEWCAWGN